MHEKSNMIIRKPSLTFPGKFNVIPSQLLNSKNSELGNNYKHSTPMLMGVRKGKLFFSYGIKTNVITLKF